MTVKTYTTHFYSDQIGETRLRELLDSMQAVVPAEVEVEYVFIVKTNNGSLSDALSAVAAAMPRTNGHVAGGNGRKPGKKAPAPEMGRASLRREKDGEIFSTRRVNADLAAEAIPVNTVYINHKNERLVVMNIGGLLELVKEPKA